MSDKPEHIGIDNKSPTEKDRIDLNHEISGDAVGRIQRFLTNSDVSLYGENAEKKKRERTATTMLEYLLLHDAQYRETYQHVQTLVNDTQDVIDHVLNDIDHKLDALDHAIASSEANTAELPDGTKVFKAADGSVYTDDGRKLSDEEALALSFPEGATSWEDYQRLKNERDTLRQQRDDIKTYQRETVDPARERLDDHDDPPSQEELDAIERDLQDKRPASLLAYFEDDTLSHDQNNATPGSVAETITKTDISNMPPIGHHFDKARLAIPDLSDLPALPNDPAPSQEHSAVTPR